MLYHFYRRISPIFLKTIVLLSFVELFPQEEETIILKYAAYNDKF